MSFSGLASLSVSLCFSISESVASQLTVCDSSASFLFYEEKQNFFSSVFSSLSTCFPSLPFSRSLFLCNMISAAAEPLCAAEQLPLTLRFSLLHMTGSGAAASGAGAAQPYLMLLADLEVLCFAAAQAAGCPMSSGPVVKKITVMLKDTEILTNTEFCVSQVLIGSGRFYLD